MGRLVVCLVSLCGVVTAPVQAGKFTQEQCQRICMGLDGIKTSTQVFPFFDSVFTPEELQKRKRIIEWLQGVLPGDSQAFPEVLIAQLATHLVKTFESVVINQRNFPPDDLPMARLHTRNKTPEKKAAYINQKTIEAIRAAILKWSECNCEIFVKSKLAAAAACVAPSVGRAVQ